MTASLVVHLAALVLMLAGAANGRGNDTAKRDGASLEVILETRQPSAAHPAGSFPPVAAANELRAPTPRRPASSGAMNARPAAKARPASRLAADNRMPTVIIDDRVPHARFAATLEGGPLADFPLEVATPVVVAGKLAVPYPTAAVEGRREGRVVAWAIVDRDGAVEAAEIVEGEPEFAAAVRSALASAKLVPAHHGGVPTRFYVMLEVAFLLDAGSRRLSGLRTDIAYPMPKRRPQRRLGPVAPRVAGALLPASRRYPSSGM